MKKIEEINPALVTGYARANPSRAVEIAARFPESAVDIVKMYPEQAAQIAAAVPNETARRVAKASTVGMCMLIAQKCPELCCDIAGDIKARNVDGSTFGGVLVELATHCPTEAEALAIEYPNWQDSIAAAAPLSFALEVPGE